jgi:hypothetical protein
MVKVDCSFRDVTSCSLVDSFEHFGGICCLSYKSDKVSHLHSHLRDNLSSYMMVEDHTWVHESRHIRW